jgi:hypothetical protein
MHNFNDYESSDGLFRHNPDAGKAKMISNRIPKVEAYLDDYFQEVHAKYLVEPKVLEEASNLEDDVFCEQYKKELDKICSL